jgi:hypothetical protein
MLYGRVAGGNPSAVFLSAVFPAFLRRARGSSWSRWPLGSPFPITENWELTTDD